MTCPNVRPTGCIKVWRKSEVEVKKRRERVIKKMKHIQSEKELDAFVYFFLKEFDANISFESLMSVQSSNDIHCCHSFRLCRELLL